MAREIELKLAFPPEALDAVLAHPLLAGAARQGSRKTLINTYFDTPDLALSAKRIALRTRKSGENWLQTVKCAAESFGGLSSRPEWEKAFSGEFDFSDVEATEVRRTLEKHHAALVPLFSTDFVRDTLKLEPRDGVSILVMIDRGEISAAGRQTLISELELELVSGDADDLLELACALASGLPLIPFDPSKAARGYQLFHDTPVTPQSSLIDPVPDDADVLDSFRQRALVCLSAWSANHHGALSYPDPEFIHQLRVSLTRLRGLLRIFEPALPEGFADDWRARLQALSQSLGPLRSSQVLCDELILPATEDDVDGYLPPLARHAEQWRESALAEVRLQLAAAGAGMLALEFHRALLALPANSASLTGTLRRQAARHLHEKAQAQLERVCSERSNESLHALRILIKQLRLVCELAPRKPHKAVSRRLRALADLQSRLGRLNDLADALPVLGRWVSSDPRFAAPVAFLTGWHAATSLKLRRTILRRAGLVLADAGWQDEKAGASRKKPSHH
ncbi:CYTH and CHAD domain-containing protein [Uliginosibacterium paludis]|uniref:CYTH and CHAD domain-containing protein n=1 Tax=Uliginosibacterium paludis TaxID=1615952 RepID=A0ABV2CRP6_9RHOO